MTSSPGKSTPDRELADLLGAVCNDNATDNQRSRLREMLENDTAVRRLYRRYMTLHAAIRLRHQATPFSSLQPILDRRATPTGRYRRRMVLVSAVTGTLATVLLVVALSVRQPAEPRINPASSYALARLTRSAGARWADESQSVAAGTNFAAGVLELTHGFVELTFDADAKAVLQAPVRLELVERRHIALNMGRLVVRADGSKGAFIVDTPKATVTDLGTEFGVGVGPGGDSQVQVYDGTVVAEWKTSDGVVAGSRRLNAGQTIRIDRQWQRVTTVPFETDRFVRTFPVIDGDTAGGAIYNRSRLHTLCIVQRTRPIEVDGSLDDWDLTRRFRSACVEPYDKTYFVEGAMMYDSEFLYIGAHVGDPTPMRNTRDAAADPEMAWQGGSVVVRLSTDPALGWPLLGQYGYASDAPPGETRLSSDSIVHLMMWYDARGRQPRLGLEYGLDYSRRVLDSPGWQGAFRRDADGRGYTMEYAIPWTLLNPRPGPPTGGEVTAAAWIVHWSDAEGKLGRGHLVEFTNPSEPKYDMMIGRTWGKAVYLNITAQVHGHLQRMRSFR